MFNGLSVDRTGSSMKVRFWGTRGGIPVPGPATLKYGGETACVELRCGGRLVILDAGSGIRGLGETLSASGQPLDADLLLSHFHLDHILGLGFVAPLYEASTSLRIHSAAPAGRLRAILAGVLSAPLMPDLLAQSSARLSFNGFSLGQRWEARPGLSVMTAALRHPGGSTGYRITWQDKSVAYVTDTEHVPGQPDPSVLAIARDVDLLIYDSSYNDDELPGRLGWGHSTWQEGIRVADAASVKRLALFHHDRRRTDAELDVIAVDAAARRPGTVVTGDGMELIV
jgi:phosphoribosyl 1,2-cyclic phosphodiesterase